MPPPPSPQLPSRPLNTITSHTGPINTIAFSHLGGTYILTGSSDRSIHLSRTEPPSTSTSTSASTTSSPIQKYISHGYAVLSLHVSNQNTHFASSGGDRSAFYWDIQSPSTPLRRLGSNTSQSHSARIPCVSFAGESDSILATGSDDRSVRLWDLKSRDNRPLQILEEAKDGISALVVRAEEIIAGSVDGRVRTYDVRMGRIVVDVQAGPVTSLDMTRDGKCVLVGCLDGKIRLMDRMDGACLRIFPDVGMEGKDDSGGGGYKNDGLRLQSCLGANEGLVVSGSEADGNVRAWDVMTGKLVANLPVSENGKVISVVRWRDGIKSQGKQAVWAAGGTEGIVRIYGE